ncbi:MAG TPA: asparagine synthase C-terminal domain-containing protein, partial [Casimicrobiaceae bacterium]|nr:asparagine synthase C-terminal domain-containing protein [Casimicrobiaceae bacterium]
MARLSASGASALAELKGGYGVFFIDRRSKKIFLAVDRYSIETACFGMEGDRLCFSDRADAVPVDIRTLSVQSIYDYVYFHCVPAPATIFREVRRLEHGGHLCIDQGELRIGSHWQPRFEEVRDTPLAARSEQFRELLRQSVAVEAAGPGKLGCFLSGGTDSSTVAGMLCRTSGERARTYSIGFDAPGYDEMEYARVAARHFDTDHHEYYVTADDVVRGVGDVSAHFDQPFGNSSVVPAYFCARMALGDGVTRMLAGDGGDELFGGNTRYRFQQFLDLYQRIPGSLRGRVIEPALSGSLGRAGIPGLKHAAAYVRNARIPMPDRMQSFNLLSRVGAAQILDASLLESVDQGAPLRAQQHAYAGAVADSTINRMLHYDWKYTLADTDLPKVRGAAGLAGLTVGYPLLADELADFSLRLPSDYKLRNFKLRWFFKEALRDFLPDATIKKKKHGFGLPFGLWATRHAGLRNLAGDSLAELERRGILREGFRDGLMGHLLSAHPGYYGELVWILMMLEQWL